ncbi:MAG: hypothetical protein EOO23_08415 [Comamonadaceae bacterium]|nr:MAG: hypothetical protein EOO23_08415 [Comamonadaceae bacterium]
MEYTFATQVLGQTEQGVNHLGCAFPDFNTLRTSHLLVATKVEENHSRTDVVHLAQKEVECQAIGVLIKRLGPDSC